MKQTIADLAIDYGRALFKQVTEEDSRVTDDTLRWETWTKHLFTASQPRARAMLSIWSRIRVEEGRVTNKFVPLTALSLHDENGAWSLNPVEREKRLEDDAFRQAASALHTAFLKHGGDEETDFDRFSYLMQKYASTLPCTYGEEGVSLFRQWTMVAALIAITQGQALDELPELALVGLDLPGIQTMVYTITARGAGKGVRGRSAFIQLLISAIVERLLDELDLCRANVIISAGGNALLLCRYDAGLAKKLQEIEKSINTILFNGDNYRLPFAGFKGDLFLALAHIQLPHSALRYQAEPIWDEEMGKYVSQWQYYEKRLKEALGTAKQQPFRTMTMNAAEFSQLFAPDVAISDRFCAICRRPEEMAGEFEEDNELPDSGPAQPGATCPECKGFEELAREMAQPQVYLNCHRQKPAQRNRAGEKIGVSAWQEALNAIRRTNSATENADGYWYSIDTHPAANAMTLALSPDDFPNENVDGFYPLTTATPTEKGASQARPTIRDNSTLADDTPSSLKRLGVLKADVDNLASLLVNSLDKRSAVQTAMLSDSLTLFFGGWLHKLCTGMEIAPGVQTRDKVYVLYAGGDDLLIIGSWDVMPYLAQRIAGDFERFTGQNAGVHLSAGLVLAGGKEPLYAAVESANDELDRAKQKGQPRPEKNAISFLGKRHSWAAFKGIVEWQEKLVDLRNAGAPSSLLTSLLTIYQQYRQDKGEIPGIKARGEDGLYQEKPLFLGPWLWKMIYSLARIDQSNGAASGINEIQQELLKAGRIERMSVSARWAQFLKREGDRHHG
ncbi:MAG: type III-A CRISPR-associated protein Cas10/Csm1 [Caldilineaceae bacterium]